MAPEVPFILNFILFRLDGIIEGFARYQRLQSSYDDDGIDRLNHIYTVTLLVVFSIFVSGKQYVGNAIECFSAQYELGMAKREYARSYCWLKNTYSARPDKSLPEDMTERRAGEIPYYQWVPVILLVMAAMFKLPNLIWRVFSYNSGLDLSQTASMIINTQLMSTAKSKETVRQLAECLDRWLWHIPLVDKWNAWTKVKRVLSQKMWFCFFFWGTRFGTYLSGLYLFVKILFFFNAIVVFAILWRVLGSWYIDFGFKLLYSQTQEKPSLTWPDVPFFPKTTFCDFEVWQQANVNTYTLQCTLPINLFNEKIFAFLWFWMTVVTFANGVNLTFWLYKCYFGSLHYSYIRAVLEARGQLITDLDRHVATNFSKSYLGRDGCLALYVVTQNSTMVASADLICELFHIYKAKPGVQKEKGHGDIMYI